MPKTFEPLQILKLSEQNTYTHPPLGPELVYITDPAVDVIINFSHVKPLITTPTHTIDQANVDMKFSGTHIMLVVEDETVVGVVSSEDILGEKPMHIAQERRIRRDEILVSAVMTPQHELMAIDYKDVKYAKVGHLLTTLTENKQHYALIVDTEENSTMQTVHGLVYIYDIIKRLDNDLPTELKEARSLLELQKKLR